MKNLNLEEPFPGDYKFVEKVKPTELECAAKIIIPKQTIEPWQVHYAPFKEKIIVEHGELWIQKPIWYKNYTNISYVQEPENIDKYCEGEIVKMSINLPHRPINRYNEDLTIIVESSPGPEHRQDLEPEFSSLTECIDALHKELIKNALRNY
jgi:hypothetical protein